MKRSLKGLVGYKIITRDGEKGKARDFLFDEKLWTIRYVEAVFGKAISTQRILIPRAFLKTPQWQEKVFPVELNKDDIERCPKLADHLPVSLQYEKELVKHYNIQPYWAGSHLGTMGMYYPPRPVRVPYFIAEEKEVKSMLRSFNEMENYFIHALDDRFGHVEDLIIDDQEWQILYVLVDTSNWLPWSKKVLIPVDSLNNVSYANREIRINLEKDTVKSAPEFNPSEPIDEAYEEKLYDFYASNLSK